MKAIILAGGLGTRLRSVTGEHPKPMTDLLGRPLMEHIVQLLRENGFDEICCTLRYRAGEIMAHFGDGARFGVNMLMNYFLDERFDKKFLKWVAAIDENLFDDDSTGAAQSQKQAASVNAARPTDRYYVQMVIAWYMATALAKQWDAAFPYIKGRKLSPWIHAKTIQKACESYRITQEQKEILRGLK